MLPKMCVCGGVRGGKIVPRNLFLCTVDSRKEIFWGENVGGGGSNTLPLMLRARLNPE